MIRIHRDQERDPLLPEKDVAALSVHQAGAADVHEKVPVVPLQALVREMVGADEEACCHAKLEELGPVTEAMESIPAAHAEAYDDTGDGESVEPGRRRVRPYVPRSDQGEDHAG